jgi:HK97 family phage major capsid protein
MSADFSQQLQGITEQQGSILKRMEETFTLLEADGADRVALKASLDEMKGELSRLTEERKQKERDADNARISAEILELRDAIRTPSKAGLIGNGSSRLVSSADPSALFFWSVWAARNTQSPEYHAIGKANLEAMGSYWADVPSGDNYGGQISGKATLGDSAAAGGNVVPNNVLNELIEQRVEDNPFRRLMPFQDVGFVVGVDIPTEPLAPARAVVQAYGATKTNRNLTYGKYTATMYTVALIYDIGNQLLRNSRGTAEANVRSALNRAFAQGEAYYILQGSGTSEPKGLLTSIGGSGTFVTTFSSPSDSTVAGSGAAAINKAAGDIANRAHIPDGVVCNAADFWQFARQGSDTAGFWLNTSVGPTGITPLGLEMRLWGLPVYGSTYMPSDSLVVGEWRTTPVYTGQSYRVDVSDVAGTRWDTNVTGFRGEEELGFNADPFVVQGKFQRIVNAIP